MNRVYLDYNATTPVEPGVLDAMLPREPPALMSSRRSSSTKVSSTPAKPSKSKAWTSPTSPLIKTA